MKEKYLSLQILRGIAAWMVVYHHYMQCFYDFKYTSKLGSFFSTYGDFGVDLFFTLSGFVMYFSATSTHANAKQFLVNRVFRVVPAYWFYTLLIIPLLIFYPSEFSFTDYTTKSLIDSLLFIPNYNPSGLGVYPLLTVGWTLNFEMMFYLILTISLFLSPKKAIYFCMFFVFMSPFVWPKDILFSSVLNNFKLYEFLMGLLIAYVISHRIFLPIIRFRIILSLISFFIAIVCFQFIESHSIYKLISAGAFMFSTIMINAYININSKIVIGFVKLGDYSYSTYLAHVAVLFTGLHYFGNELSQIEEFLILLFLTISLYFISKYSFKFIEQNKCVNILKDKVLAVELFKRRNQIKTGSK